MLPRLHHAVLVPLCFLCLSLSPPTRAQQSENFRLKRVTVSATAAQQHSPSFGNTVTGIDIGGASSVCPIGMAVTTGFWSVRGVSAIPTILTAVQSGVQPDDVDLSWTGLGSSFNLYRSESPAGLVSVENLYGVEMVCNDTDTNALIDPGAVLYYQVEPSSQ